MPEDIKVIDGAEHTDKGGKTGHPSFGQGFLDDIDEIKVEDLDSPKDKDKGSEEDEIDEDDTPIETEEDTTEDIEEENEEEVTEEPDEEEEKPEEVQENEVDGSYLQEVKGVISELKQAHASVELANRSVGEAPEQPNVSEDDEPQAWFQYRSDVSAYKRALTASKAQADFAREKVKEIASKQESLFREAHEGEDLKGFENWMKDDYGMQSSFFTGKKSLETLYAMYKADAGIKTTTKQISALKKKGQNFKKVDTKGSGRDNTSTKQKYDAKYKYMNIPELKDMREMLLKNDNPFTGRRPTVKEVNGLLETEWKSRKGKF